MPGRTIRLVFLILLTISGCAKNPASVSLPALAPLPRLRADLDQSLAAPALQRATWAVLIQSLDKGETLYSLNAARLMMPASNMKIVTLAAAGERLGWDYRFITRLMAAGSID